jgi:hypothetical protein
VIFGLLMVIGGGVYHFSNTPPKTTVIASAPSTASNSQASTASYKAKLPDLEVNWGGGLKRDVFDTRELLPRISAPTPQTRPSSPEIGQIVAAEAKAILRLQGTFNGASPAALINGGMYYSGDRVKGFRIVEIQDNKIIVERQGVLLSIASEQNGGTDATISAGADETEPASDDSTGGDPGSTRDFDPRPADGPDGGEGEPPGGQVPGGHPG